jgi:hypothetical protein
MKNKKTLDKLEKKVPKSKNVEVENTYATGGVEIEMTKPNESQTVEVKGMKRVLASKNKNSNLVLVYDFSIRGYCTASKNAVLYSRQGCLR